MIVDLSIPKKQMEILPLLITSASNSDCKVDVFNAYLNSANVQIDPTLVLNYNPFSKLQVINQAVTPLSQSVVFNAQGSAYVWRNINDFIAIVGVKMPYYSILQYLQGSEFKVKRMRITASTVSQVIQPFRIKQSDIFGTFRDITIHTDTFISPMQVQSKIIDMDIEFTINGFTSIEYNILANNYVNIEFIIQK